MNWKYEKDFCYKHGGMALLNGRSIDEVVDMISSSDRIESSPEQIRNWVAAGYGIEEHYWIQKQGGGK